MTFAKALTSQTTFWNMVADGARTTQRSLSYGWSSMKVCEPSKMERGGKMLGRGYNSQRRFNGVGRPDKAPDVEIFKVT